MNKNNFNYTSQYWSVVRQDTEYQTPIFSLLKRKSRLPEENLEGDFYIIDAPDWTNIIAITEDQQVILVEQFRHGIQKATLEIPGGAIDGDEEPMNAAKRELLEETGYSSEDWIKLGEVSSNSAILSNYTHLYLARNCQLQQEQNLDEHELIELHTYPLDEFLNMVRKGVIHHSIVVAAVAHLLLNPELME